MKKHSFQLFLLKTLLWRAATTVLVTASVWLTIWFYDWSAVNMGQSYATAFGWVSAITGAGVVCSLLFYVYSGGEW